MAIRQIESSFGKGAVMQLGSTYGVCVECYKQLRHKWIHVYQIGWLLWICYCRKIAERVEVISSGSLSLDLALGVGGIPRGSVTVATW